MEEIDTVLGRSKLVGGSADAGFEAETGPGRVARADAILRKMIQNSQHDAVGPVSVEPVDDSLRHIQESYQQR